MPHQKRKTDYNKEYQEKCKTKNQQELWEESHDRQHAKVEPTQGSSLRGYYGTAMISGRPEPRSPCDAC